MHAFKVPQSVKDYFENKEIHSVVDSLLGHLDGTVPASTRKDLLAYSQGVLLATQVRADYVQMLNELFDLAFEKSLSDEKNHLNEYFDVDDNGIQDIWDDDKIVSFLYRPSDVDQEHEHLAVHLLLTEDLQLQLQVYFALDEDVEEFPAEWVAALAANGWQDKLDEGGEQFLEITICEWQDLVDSTEEQVSRLQDAGRELLMRTVLA